MAAAVSVAVLALIYALQNPKLMLMLATISWNGNLLSKETANLLKGGDAKSQTYRVRVYEYPACTPRWLDRLLLSKNQVTHQ